MGKKLNTKHDSLRKLHEANSLEIDVISVEIGNEHMVWLGLRKHWNKQAPNAFGLEKLLITTPQSGSK